MCCVSQKHTQNDSNRLFLNILRHLRQHANVKQITVLLAKMLIQSRFLHTTFYL